MVSTLLDPTDWWIAIPAATQTAAWDWSRVQPTDWSRWNAYLNQVCLQTCLPWLQAEALPTAQAGLEPGEFRTLWEVVNGSVIRVGDVRLVLIPTEAIDQTEVAVPQEWVDLPSWVADYYLAVQLDALGTGLCLYGYASHRQLKTRGVYDADDRTYRLERDAFTADLNVLWLAQAHCTAAQTRAAVSPIPTLSTAQADSCIARLGNPAVVLPRLEVPWVLWAGLLERSDGRQRLYQQRQAATPTRMTQLGNWLQGQFETWWQALEDFSATPSPAMATRSLANGPSSSGAIQRVKALAIGGGQIRLQVSITSLPEGDVRVELRLSPATDATTLPGDTQIRLLTIAGEELGRASASPTETLHLQLRAAVGEHFCLEILCNGDRLTERFEL